MSDKPSLTPIEEQAVDFYGDEITTALVRTEHLQATATLEQIRATALAVAQWAEQQLQREAVSSPYHSTIGIALPPIVTVDQWQVTEGPLPF